MVRIMHHGGCENWLIARSVARCARSLIHEEMQRGIWQLSEIPEQIQAIADKLRQEGWYV